MAKIWEDCMGSPLFATKPIEQLIRESEEGEHRLKRALSAWDLIAIGIGCIIGTGIFVLTGKVAIENAGPGVMISFVICGFACIFAALCYAEFASLIPIAGSAYTFSYASLGEIFAWIIGWDLLLEYGVSTSAVASGWSSYFVDLLAYFHVHWPAKLALTPADHGIVDLPAILIALLMTWLLIVGIKESATVNNLIVAIKVSISIMFIGVGLFFVNPANWHPLVPKFVGTGPVLTSKTVFQHGFSGLLDLELWKIIGLTLGAQIQQGFGGWAGIFLGAAIIFFAYIGFDAVSTTSEEAKNPSRDLPIGIIGSLLICTVLYILMSAVFTGIVKCDGTLQLSSLGTDQGAPMAYAMKQVPVPWISHAAGFLVTIGALCGITSVILVTLLGQSRIFFAMSRDGLLPAWVSKVHPKYQTPYIGTLITGIAVAIVGGIVPLPAIAEMANIGTLFAFVLVSGGIIFLRKFQPQKVAAFRTPFVPLTPLLSILFCLALMLSLPLITWIRFLVWLAAGLLIYFFYGVRNSTLRQSMNASSNSTASVVK
jgi:APA family basic amino acid/polyamine antiporter